MYRQEPLVCGDLYAAAERFAAEHEPRLAGIAGRQREAALKETWGKAAALGWTGVLIPAEHGGSGGDVNDLAAIVQGSGRKGLPMALAQCGTVALLLEDAAAASGRAAALMSAVADGSARVTPLIDAPFIPASRRSGAVVVNGCRELESVPEPTHYLTACSVDGDEVSLLAVEAGTAGVLAESFDRPDGGIGVRLTFSDVAIPSADILATGAAATAAVEAAATLSELMTCVEGEASIAALLENVVEHLSARVQFGAPLAQQQVLRHRSVDMYLANEILGALIAVSLRTWTARGSPPRTTRLASAHLRNIAREIAKAGIQLHGAMGLSEELLAARLCRRLLTIEFRLPAGEEDAHVS